MRTRHNVGVRAVERLAERLGISITERRFEGRFGCGMLRGSGDERPAVGLLLPETYMNRSGRAVAAALVGLGVEAPTRDVLVVYDDADLPFGRLRLRPRGSDGGHRGMRSVIEALASSEVPRLRIGIGRSVEAVGTVEYVLDSFDPEEERALPAHLGRAADAVEAVFRDGMVAAMNAFNG